MGLFDIVIIEYPLPGDIPACAVGAKFQTKDLDCLMEEYIIRGDGQLAKAENGWLQYFSQYTGVLGLYWSNVVASGPGIYTKDGEDAVYLEYNVKLVDGKVVEVTETRNTSERAAKSKNFFPPRMTDEEKLARAARIGEDLNGRRLYVKYGGESSVGYWVIVVASNERQLVVSKENGDFEILHRWSRDSTFFDSGEDALAYEAKRKEDWERREREFIEEVSSRK